MPALIDRLETACKTVRIKAAQESEAEVRDLLAERLVALGFHVSLEVRFGRCRIDIVVCEARKRIGIEVKRGRPQPAVSAQLRRYAEHMDGLILFCERSASIDLTTPKPVRVVAFGRAWGIAS